MARLSKTGKVAAPKPRQPGRPITGATDQRERLLDAAIDAFAAHGIAATTLRAIATRAGVTPALLHYYFKSKTQLVGILLDERIAPFIAVSTAPLLKPLPSPRATLRLFLQTHMRNLAANPWLPRLMVREVLSEGGTLRERIQAQFSATLSPKMLMLIVAAQRQGEIRDDLDPLLTCLSVISLAVFPFAAAPLWREVAQKVAKGVARHEHGSELQRMSKTAATLARPDNDSLIEHTLALFDSALEKPHAKPKR